MTCTLAGLKIINATGFSCMTLDIYEIDKYIVGLFQIFVDGSGIEKFDL